MHLAIQGLYTDYLAITDDKTPASLALPDVLSQPTPEPNDAGGSLTGKDAAVRLNLIG